MIFLCNAQGTITSVIPEPINQGSIGVNRIVLIAPYPKSTVISATFTLPNGMKFYPQYVGKGESTDYDYLMSAVESFDGKGLNIDGVTVNVWQLTLDKALTQLAGNVKVQFLAMGDGGVVLGSTSAEMPINRGNAYLNPSVTAADLNSIAEYLNAAENAVVEAEGFKNDSEGYADAAKGYAEETKLNADRYSPWDVVATQEIALSVLEGMPYRGLKSYLFLNVDFTALNLNNFINGDGIPQINIADSIEKLEFRGCTFESAQGVPLALKFRYAGSQCSIAGAKGDELIIEGITDVIDCRAALIQNCEYVTACDAYALDGCESVTDTTAETFHNCIFVDPFTVIGFVPSDDVGKVATLTDDGTYKPERLAKTIRAVVNPNNYKIKIALDDVNGNEMSEAEIDLPLESVVVGATVSEDGTKLILTLQNGNTVDVPIGDIFRGLATEEWVNEKLADYATEDYVDTQLSGTATEGWVEDQIADAESRLSQQMETLPPYDVVTNRVYTNYEDSYLKLTIDNLLDGTAESFQPFELVCLGYEGFPTSAICTITIDGADTVRVLEYNAKYPHPIYPRYYTNDGGNVYLYFEVTGIECLQVYVHGLIEKCTGASLELVNSLPANVLDCDVERHLTENYVTYTEPNGTPAIRPIGSTPQSNGVVCRNANKGIEVRSLGSGQTYADNEAVPFGYIRDTMLPNAGGGGGGGNANIDVTAEVGQTIIVKEVDANGKPTKWESADYQEKICGEEFSELLPNTTATLVEEDGAFVTECNFDFVAGGEYIIDWNGTLYSGVAEEINGLIFVGNVLAVEGTGDTGEPFVVSTNEGMLIAFPLDGSAELVIGVSGNKIQSIAKKFLPKGVMYGMPYYSVGTFDLKGWYSAENQLGDDDIISETRGADGTGTTAWVNTSVNKIAFEELLNFVNSSSRVLAILNNRGTVATLTAADNQVEGFFEVIKKVSKLVSLDQMTVILRWSESDNCVQRSCVVTSSYIISGL